MLGAFVGDCVGSEFEFPIGIHRDPTAALFGAKAHFTDDTVCTSAIAQWLISGKEDPTRFLHEMGNLHLARGFGGKFLEWVRSENPQPYGSWGNGSAMRASPIALWSRTDEEAMDLARRSAEPTHGHPEAVKGAQAVALCIRRAMEGMPATEICSFAEDTFGYAIHSLDPAALRFTHKFDVSCAGTVPLALACVERGGSFEGAMRLCISMGGDADTLAAIAGPVCEGIWGIPEDFMERSSKLSTPGGLALEPILAVYGHPKVRGRINGGGVGSPLRWL